MFWLIFIGYGFFTYLLGLKIGYMWGSDNDADKLNRDLYEKVEKKCVHSTLGLFDESIFPDCDNCNKSHMVNTPNYLADDAYIWRLFIKMAGVGMGMELYRSGNEWAIGRRGSWTIRDESEKPNRAVALARLKKEGGDG